MSTTYSAARAILDTLRPTEPDDDCDGLVGAFPADRDLPETVLTLRQAGYEVSDSKDADGKVWVWVR